MWMSKSESKAKNKMENKKVETFELEWDFYMQLKFEIYQNKNKCGTHKTSLFIGSIIK